MRPDPLLGVIFQPSEDSLRRTLVAARVRRVRRVIVRAAASAACVVMGFLLLSPSAPHPPVAPRRSTVQNVSNRPLLPREIVHTSRQSVEVISTANTATTPTEVVADSELLASYAGGRAALIGGFEVRRLVEF